MFNTNKSSKCPFAAHGLLKEHHCVTLIVLFGRLTKNERDETYRSSLQLRIK